MKRIILAILRGFGTAGRATVALIGIASLTAALANYTMTQGAGTTFGSIVVSTVHYAQQLLCDPTTPTQCTGVDASGNASVNVKTSVLPNGAATSANQSSQITQETATAAALGTTADATCGTATGTCSLIALQKFANNTNPVLAAGPNTIGNVGADPSSGKGTPAMAFLALPATTTTQIIALSGTKTTYVTFSKLFAGGTVNVTLKYGTGTNCGTGTTTLEGPYPLIAQTGWTEQGGVGPVLIVPSGQALCVTTDASVSGGIKMIYQQF